MIKVIIEGNSDGEYKLELNGHAGQADIGHDIVCSACTILAYTVAQVVNDEAVNDGLERPPAIMLESGRSIIFCKPKESSHDKLWHTYQVARVGYKLLAHNYPQYVELYTVWNGESRKYKPKESLTKEQN